MITLNDKDDDEQDEFGEFSLECSARGAHWDDYRSTFSIVSRDFRNGYGKLMPMGRIGKHFDHSQ